MIERWQTRRIARALRERRVVLLAGARQCGKTTLARAIGAGAEYRTLDDPGLLAAAEADPLGFVRHKGPTLIIDEIQRAPVLLPAIKLMVDADTRPGQYLLTGSASLAAIPTARESLPGRVGRVRLRPFCQGEIDGAAPGLLPLLFAGTPPETPGFGRDRLIELGLRGGYPEAVALPPDSRAGWYRDYIDALLERDLRDIARIHNHDGMHRLVEVAAAWSAGILDIAKITSRLGISRPTVASYLNALEALHLAERVPAWTKSDYERVASKDKLFMTDSGLMAAVLGWQAESLRFDSEKLGRLAETFAYTALMPHLDTSDDCAIHHYRDWENREIDLLVERRSDGALLGIEVKAAEAPRADHFRHLVWFRDAMAGGRPFTGIVLHAGARVLPFGDRLWAVPFGVL